MAMARIVLILLGVCSFLAILNFGLYISVSSRSATQTVLDYIGFGFSVVVLSICVSGSALIRICEGLSTNIKKISNALAMSEEPSDAQKKWMEKMKGKNLSEK